jgi:hypothetical protein
MKAMSKKVKYSMAATFFVWFFAYLVFSFVKVTFDFTAWGEGTRVGYVFMSLILNAISVSATINLIEQ